MLQKSDPTLVNHFQKSGNSNGKVSYICICIIFSEIFNIILASLSILKKYMKWLNFHLLN